MDQPPNASVNLDSFIRKRAQEQRQLGSPPKKPASTTPPPSKSEKKIPPPHPATTESDGDIEPATTAAEVTPDCNHSASSEAQQKGKLGRETAEALIDSTHSAKQSKAAARKAAADLASDAEESQARLAAEAAQEAAQVSLEAIEFAHQAARSAIEEASAGREQKKTYNTHRLLVLLNITLLVAALSSLYLFIWPGISQEQKPVATQVDTDDKTTEHLTQQLLLDTQRERLRSEQELTLMERSLAKLAEEQQALKKHLNETQNLLNSERQRIQQKETLDITFQKMEQDLKQRIAELEKKLQQKEQPQLAAQPVAPVIKPTPQATAQPVAPDSQPASTSNQREKEVDQILQKLYSLHSELSQQKGGVEGAVPAAPASPGNRPYSYNRK